MDSYDTTNTMKNMIHQQDKGVTYSNPEPLSAFLKRNVATDGSEELFLTTAGTGDQTIKFTVDPNSNTIQPRDWRYRFITSQPYASSSYGLLQLTRFNSTTATNPKATRTAYQKYLELAPNSKAAPDVRKKLAALPPSP